MAILAAEQMAEDNFGPVVLKEQIATSYKRLWIVHQRPLTDGV